MHRIAARFHFGGPVFVAPGKYLAVLDDALALWRGPRTFAQSGAWEIVVGGRHEAPRHGDLGERLVSFAQASLEVGVDHELYDIDKARMALVGIAGHFGRLVTEKKLEWPVIGARITCGLCVWDIDESGSLSQMLAA